MGVWGRDWGKRETTRRKGRGDASSVFSSLGVVEMWSEAGERAFVDKINKKTESSTNKFNKLTEIFFPINNPFLPRR
jgi:hypothetical protein